jgi:energy-coupling factor transporter transmembrane protein EcfT
MSLIVPAFASAIRRSERLSIALATRGFDPDKIPASVCELAFRASDISILAAVLIGWVVWLVARIGAERMLAG